MTMTSQDVDRLIRALERNSEIVALVHLLEKAERCQQMLGNWDYDRTHLCNDFAVVAASYGGARTHLCQQHLDERAKADADPAVREAYKKNWGKDLSPPHLVELPRAKEVRRLLTLLKREG